MTSRRLAALADQGIISATNFLLFLYCARVMDAAAWGMFGFAYAAVLFCQGFQRAAVTIPMITMSPTPTEWRKTSAAWAGLNTCLLLVVLAVGVAVSLVAVWVHVEWVSVSALHATALAAPMLWMEFARRATIQNHDFRRLVSIAVAYALGVVLATAVWPSTLEKTWMPVVAVVAGGAAGTIVFVMSRQSILIGTPRPAIAIPGHRSFSFWATLSHLGYSGYNFGVQALLGAISGPAALGIFHACRALLQPINTLIGAMDSIDKPHAARAYASDHRAGLFRSLRMTVMLLGALGGAYIILAGVFDTWLLRLAYGARYAEQSNVVLWWCVVAALTIIAQPVESGLYVIGRTREMFYSRIAASIGSLGFAYLLIGHLGPAGAVAAMAIGFGTSAAIGMLILRKLA